MSNTEPGRHHTWVSCCRAGREPAPAWRAGRVCPQSPGTPGHTLPVGLLERHFLSRDGHVPSHSIRSHHSASRQPTTHRSSAATLAQPSFVFAAAKALARPFVLCISLSPLMGLLHPRPGEGLNTQSESESRQLESRLRLYLPVAEKDSQCCALNWRGSRDSSRILPAV